MKIINQDYILAKLIKREMTKEETMKARKLSSKSIKHDLTTGRIKLI